MMRPEALQRALIRAVAFGDTANEQHLRRQLRGIAHVGAADHLHAAVLVCLAHRFGEPAPPNPRETSQVNRNHTVLDHTSLSHTGLDHITTGYTAIDRAACDGEAFDRPAIDDDELGRFMAELRAIGPGLCPPQNFLEVEAVIRGLYGEPHLIEEIGAKQQREALAFILRYLTESIPEIREGFETVIDRAQALQRHWLTG